MTTQRKAAHSYSKTPQESNARCRQNMRFLLGQLAQTLPAHQPGFQSAFLLHFQRAADAAGPRRRAAQPQERSR